jgi:hypothetical protein
VDSECGCELDALFPCGAIGEECRAGYKFGCDCGDHDFHIGSAVARDAYLAKVAEDERDDD